MTGRLPARNADSLLPDRGGDAAVVRGRIIANRAGQGAQIILIPKHLRMDWTDVMVLDSELSVTALRVACVIGTHFGNKSGMAFVSRDMIAGVCDIDTSTVKRSIAELERRGYLIVQRRAIGRRADGSPVFGGKGTANEYLPAIDATQLSATDRGQKLIANAVKAWDQRTVKRTVPASAKRVMGAPLSVTKRVADDPLSQCERGSFDNPKRVMGDPPTLKLPSEANSTGKSQPPETHPLGAAGDALLKRLGNDKFAAWFSLVTVGGDSGETLTLIAPSKFVASYIAANFDSEIMRAWSDTGMAVRRVTILAGPTADDGAVARHLKADRANDPR